MTTEEELQGGIRNALDKGIPIENIIKTFVNAGYPEQSVRAAASAAASGLPIAVPKSPEPVPQIQPTKPQTQQSPTSIAVDVPKPSVPQGTFSAPAVSNTPHEGPSKMKIYFLVAVLILLLIMLGASIMFREQLSSLF